jgi:hypothetical protein
MALRFNELVNAKIDEAAVLLPYLLILSLADEFPCRTHSETPLIFTGSKTIKSSKRGFSSPIYILELTY